MNRACLDYLAELGCLVAMCVGTLVLAALLTWVGLKLAAAPVPPDPQDLTPEMLAGRWTYRWGEHDDGRIWLYPDGWYSAYHQDGGPVFFGQWGVRGRVLVLSESRLHAESGTLTEARVYRLHLTAGTAGFCGGTPVSLSRRVPFPQEP